MAGAGRRGAAAQGWAEQSSLGSPGAGANEGPAWTPKHGVRGEERSGAVALSTMPEGGNKDLNTAPGSWAARREVKQEEDRKSAEGRRTGAAGRGARPG